MEGLLREYRDEDYEQCEYLVNQAWGFDKIFSPKELSDIAKQMYTKGSVLGSNYRAVIEVNGQVAGFIFGFNENAKRPGVNLLYRLSMLWRLMRVKSEKPADKNEFLNAIKDHENNRSKVIGKGKSEIVLFVVGESYQGKGYGKRLWSDFQGKFKDSGVCSIIVETNKLGAASFYELLGFKHLADFDSPLHEFAAEGGQACIYEYSN